ncbi:hypothetical protein [Legionella sp. km772]|uniref:hypothetical protein n=1 Tax=Legionella sp. km772 TaxID=2498111 RepID=UPI000F8C42C4|nr:hypothetical protein [Legionella sp. km772]RUR12539.1 hypothetical protein ELY15_04800 [Legionella sp. km772]
MAKQKQERTIRNPLKVLAGPEIETLADYFGQGALGVYYINPTTDAASFHPLKDAYNDIIARPLDPTNKLCMSTDSNRSEEGDQFPKRTSIEFRSGPELENTQELLQLTKAYSDWLILQKDFIRQTQFKNYKKPSRREYNAIHYLNLADFINYYNSLEDSRVQLHITSPQTVFDPKNAGPDFEFRFPAHASWVVQLKYEDLAPKTPAVFTTQYNLSIPIGCIFEPDVRKAFPLINEFSLLNKEKEIAADFNESRPHIKLRQYEQEIFTSAIDLADRFFTQAKFPLSAIGARDFLRGMAYELALISTSQKYLVELFQDDALWIAEQHRKVALAKGGRDKEPSAKEVNEIAISLANTLRKSIFPYFLKATLATFFQQLHPYEQQLLQAIPKKEIRKLCQQAIQLANGGRGNTADHPGHLMFNHDSFMELFDIFYGQTFQGVPVDEDEAPADPIGCLTDRFISPSNLGSAKDPVTALVVELRAPAQGKQQYRDIQTMCSTFNSTHQALLDAFCLTQKAAKTELDRLYHGEVLSSPVSKKEKAPTPKSLKQRQPLMVSPLASITAEEEETAAVSSPPPRKSKRKAHSAPSESPLAQQSLFAKKREKPALDRDSSKRNKQMGLFSYVRRESEEGMESSSTGMTLRKRAKLD